MAQAWSDAAEEVGNDPIYNMGHVDCVENDPVCKEYDVTGFPVRQITCELLLHLEFDPAAHLLVFSYFY